MSRTFIICLLTIAAILVLPPTYFTLASAAMPDTVCKTDWKEGHLRQTCITGDVIQITLADAIAYGKMGPTSTEFEVVPLSVNEKPYHFSGNYRAH